MKFFLAHYDTIFTVLLWIGSLLVLIGQLLPHDHPVPFGLPIAVGGILIFTSIAVSVAGITLSSRRR